MNRGKFSSKLGNVDLNSCICNASGPLCTNLDELEKIDNSASCMVLSKSATLELRKGNPEPRYWENSRGSINSMGLPNNGIDFYLSVRDNFSKPYFISISGLCLEENIKILEKIRLNSEGISGLEINLSCPNIVGKGQLAYDFKMMDEYLGEIFKFLDIWVDTKSIGVKLPPYFDFWQFESAAEVLMKYPLDYITCINSIGNGLIVDIDTEQTVIKPKEGFGGIGGSYVKPTGLANVRKFYEIFQREGSKIKIVGCGGVESGRDVFEYILCGAEVVQVGTQFYKEGRRCFSRLEEELGYIMGDKGYFTLEEFRGKLKNI
jgi:dihydroorotate dehydrogenase (fumarate)